MLLVKGCKVSFEEQVLFLPEFSGFDTLNILNAYSFSFLTPIPFVPPILVYSFNYLQTCLSGHFVLIEFADFFNTF